MQFMFKFSAVLVAALWLAGCSSFTTQRYSIAADNNVALKALQVGSVGVGPIQGLPKFDTTCRGAEWLAMPDNLTFEGYVQKALADELKVAGMFEAKAPKVTLTGQLQKLEFSSRNVLSNGGLWVIGLKLDSSNGKSITVDERYEFESQWGAEAGCKQTADAYLPAVQNVIGKIIADPGFKAMLVP